jgi:hypothetical protein
MWAKSASFTRLTINQKPFSAPTIIDNHRVKTQEQIIINQVMVNFKYITFDIIISVLKE